MGKLFSYDSGLIQFLNKIVDIVFLSILWIVFSLPIFTMGASSAALYYTANKVIRHSRSHVLVEFWRAFRSNFKKATITNLILMVIYFFVIENIYLYHTPEFGVVVGKPLYIFNLILGVIVTIWALQMFPYMARFENKLKTSMKVCVYFMIRHFITSILLVGLFFVAVIVFYLLPVTIFILPAGYMLVATFLLEPIYRRYMSDEDLEAENERNMVYYN